MGLPRHDHVQVEIDIAQSCRREARRGGEGKLPRPHRLSGSHSRSTTQSPPPQSKLNPPTTATRYAIVPAHLHVRLACRTTIRCAAYAHLAVGHCTAAEATMRAHYHCCRHRACPPGRRTSSAPGYWNLIKGPLAPSISPEFYSRRSRVRALTTHSAARNYSRLQKSIWWGLRSADEWPEPWCPG
jgi:hypothetical protein